MLFVATLIVFACFMLALGIGVLRGRRQPRPGCAALFNDARCGSAGCRCFPESDEDESPIARS